MPATLDTKDIAAYTGPGKMASTTDFLLNVIPSTVVDAFAKGEILQVLLFAVMFGFALHKFGGRGTLVFDFIEKFSHVLFTIVGYIMKVAPIGAFGAMAFTIGKYGVGSLVSLGALMATFYTTCLIFIFVVLGGIARFNGFSIWKFIKYIKEELLIVLGTSSSEAALPRMMVKMEKPGREEVGRRPGDPDRLLVQPRRHLDLPDDGRGVHRAGHQHADDADAADHAAAGAAAHLQGRGRCHRQRFHRAGGHACRRWATCRWQGLALILGIDRFMSEARALTNLIGNGVATLVVAKWTNDLDEVQLNRTAQQRGRHRSAIEPEVSARQDRSTTCPAWART